MLSGSNLWCVVGSSPRVRSRPFAEALAKLPQGIISACAEQTLSSFRLRRDTGDHLRVCGADFDRIRELTWH